MRIRTPRVASALLCVVPYPSNTGFAWNYIEGLYAGVADILAAEGVVTYVAYQTIVEPPRSLAASVAKPVELDASLQSWRSIRETIGLVRELGVGTVYFTDTCWWHWALPLLRLAGVKWIVAHDHTSGHRDRPTGLRRIAKWLRSRIPGMTADRVLTVSEYVARRQREVTMIPPSRVFPILNGLAVPKLEAEPVHLELPGLDRERPIITCVCRAVPEKGVHILFRAFDQLLKDWPQELPRPALVYVGDGPAISNLEAERNSLPCAADIHMVGYRHDVIPFLYAAEVCVVPSLWEDACPLGVLEPMALGKTVVASAVGGVPEEINSGEVGVLVPRGDVGTLAQTLLELLRDKDKRTAIGLAARRRVENQLSREVHLAQIVQHLRRP